MTPTTRSSSAVEPAGAVLGRLGMATTLALRAVALHLRGRTSWAALALLSSGPALASAASELAGAPWENSAQPPAMDSIGALSGLYFGIKCVMNGRCVSGRFARHADLLHELLVLFLCISLYSLAGALGQAALHPWGQGLLLGTPWRAAILAALGALALARLPGPGLALLASLAAAWWLPAMLPGSLQLATPRALRNLIGGAPGSWAPHGPQAWLADTAFFVGLLLLAWSRAGRFCLVDEIRDPG